MIVQAFLIQAHATVQRVAKHYIDAKYIFWRDKSQTW